MGQKVHLTGVQIISLMSTSFMPLMYWYFPRIAVEHSLYDAQWSVLGVFLVGFIMAFLHGALNERFPNVHAVDVHTMVLGKWLGTFTASAFIPVYLGFLATSIYLYSILIKFSFPNTPKAAIIGALCLVAFRGSWTGIASLAGVASIVYPLTWIGVAVSSLMSLFQGERFWLTTHVADWMKMADGIYALLPLYLGFTAILVLNPYHQPKKRIRLWYPVISIFGANIVMGIPFLATLIDIGWHPNLHITFPVQYILELIRLRNGIIERMGILIILLSTMFITLYTSIQLWAISDGVAKILHMKEQRYKVISIASLVIVFVTSILFSNSDQAFYVVKTFLTPLSWIMLFGSPVLLLSVAMIRRLKVNLDPQNTSPQSSKNEP